MSSKSWPVHRVASRQHLAASAFDSPYGVPLPAWIELAYATVFGGVCTSAARSRARGRREVAGPDLVRRARLTPARCTTRSTPAIRRGQAGRVAPGDQAGPRLAQGAGEHPHVPGQEAVGAGDDQALAHAAPTRSGGGGCGG